MIPAPVRFDLDANVSGAVDGRLRDWDAGNFAHRMWNRDHSPWSPHPLDELTNRLGWLDLPTTMMDLVDDLARFAEEAKGRSDVIVLGMGGSSLAPEVFQAVFGDTPHRPHLRILDSTHPEAILDLAGSLVDPLFIVSSKSGSTLETLSFFRYFWDRFDGDRSRFVAITDPGSSLEQLASDRRFSRTFLAPADVGGRYSALSPFGLVPAAAMGVDIVALLEGAQRMAAACGPDIEARANPGLHLGAVLGELALAHRDKLTFLTAPGLAAFPGWIEQLVAESTGKDGTGIVPVVGDERNSEDRVHAILRLGNEPAAHNPGPGAVIDIAMSDKIDIGAEMYRWEFAVAAAGAVLGINPFDQPDVQAAKTLAARAMEGSLDTNAPGVAPDVAAARIDSALSAITTGDYVSVQGYLPAAALPMLNSIREALRHHGRPINVELGPRFLHSTGQLHKGGPPSGVFIQFTDETAARLPIPETDYSFNDLIGAQSRGDHAALEAVNRRLLRVELGTDWRSGLTMVAQDLEALQT